MSVKQRLEQTDKLKDYWCIPPEDVTRLLVLIEAVERAKELHGLFGLGELQAALKAVTE